MTYNEAVRALSVFIFGYQKGRSGEGGLSDCIGLIIGALDMMGIPWNGTHGTNYAIRNKCRPPKVINSVSDLKVDDLVFKRFAPGESGYDLPSAYKNDPDQHDYYHVGTVLSVEPLDIMHCSTGGIHHDTKLGKWKVHTTLTCFPEEGEKAMARTYFVSGGVLTSPIRMRKTASTSAAVVAEIPQNTNVDYLSANGGWSKIIYSGQTGYVKNEFLHSTETGTVDTDFVDPITPDIRQHLDEIGVSLANVQKHLDAIYDIAGRG